jgi:Ca2+-binding RTX toxin-like protein
MTDLPLYPYAQPSFVDTGTNMTSTSSGDDLLGWYQIGFSGGAIVWTYTGSGSPTDTDALELIGLGGDDTMNGRDGNDWFRPGMGDDVIDADWGGADLGQDLVLYDDASVQGVDVDLRITVSQNTVGSEWDTLSDIEHVSGSPYHDAIHGNNADNYLYGQGGDDFLWGHAGNDTLEGGGGYDVLEGGLGDDILWGNYFYDGVPDAASYEGASGGVTVNLSIGGPQNTVSAGFDSLFEIHDLIGSDFDDTFTGNDLDNTLDGGDGDDTLKGGLGNDTLIGGAGRDTATYLDATGAVTANLATGIVSGAAGSDTLSLIELLIGSDGFGDTLTSSVFSDELQGRGGNDTLFASAGNDVLNGGSGTDTADYDALTNGVVIDLTAGTTNKGQFGADTLTSIENAWGTEYDDTITGTSGVNVLRGEGGNDYLTGGAGNDTLHGGSGIDRAIYATATSAVVVNLATGTATGGGGTDTLSFIEHVAGSAFNDTLTGDAQANWLYGADGNDTLKGGLGNDTLEGFSGTDTVDYQAATGGVTANLLLGSATGADGSDTLLTVENLTGSSFDDTLIGDGQVNVLDGKGGNDVLLGGQGNDTLNGNGGTDTASYLTAIAAVTASLTSNTATGGAGSDTLVSIENLLGSLLFGDTLTGNNSVNTLDGSGGDDTLSGLGGIDTLLGGAGDDILIGGLANDTLDGQGGTNDRASYINATALVTVNLVTNTVTGPDGTDTLISIEGAIGSAYNDVFTGSAAANTFDGQGGLDEINAGAGNDTLLGGNGDDILRGDAGNDVIDGQGGSLDLASWFNDPAGVIVDLLAGTATDGYGNTDTLLGIENISGAAGQDNTLAGDNGINVISGFFGDDVITGRGGVDVLDGGGGGTDRFIYLAITDAPAGESIAGFVSNSGDLIDLAAIDTNPGLAGDQAFTFIGTAAFTAAGVAEVRFSAGNIYADRNGDGTAEMQIIMTGVATMVAGDFVL